MSALPARVPEAAVADRPTPEGKQALRQALGYIERASAPGTRRVYAADWRHLNIWCPGVSFVPLPATPASLATYLAAHAQAHA
jgi:hypothetical protein